MVTNYEKVKAWRKLNPDKVAAQHRRYRVKHPDKCLAKTRRCRERHLEEYRKRDAEAQRKRRINKPEVARACMERFVAKKKAIQEIRAGRPRPDTCELCGEFHLRIVFDHCHKYGHFRGWLCDRCNKVLGIVKDNPELLRSLASYLEGTQGETNNGKITCSRAEQTS